MTAEQLNVIEKLVLKSGAHDDLDHGACVMEAVAFLAGEKWSDHPECASPALGDFLRSWNDGSTDEQRQELKQYIPRLVGSKGTKAQESERRWMAADWLIRDCTPRALDLAPDLHSHAATLRALAPVVDNESLVLATRPLAEARSASAAAWDAARDAAWDAAWAAARAAVWAAARDAARDAAWDAVWDAARAAVWAAARDAAWAAAWAAAWDAAWAAAWDAARAAARDAARDAAWAAARDAARDAARARLADFVTESRISAHDLVDRLLKVTGS